MSDTTDWFLTYHLAELFLFLAILFLLVVIFYRCWNGCLELERPPQQSGWRAKFWVRYISGPGQDPMETVPLTQAEVNDDSDIRNRMVDACSLGPRLNSVSGPATAKSKSSAGGDGSEENSPLLPVRGKNMCVQECSLDISGREKLVKITR